MPDAAINKRKLWRLVPGILFSVALLYFLFTRITLGAVLENLGKAKLHFVLIAFLLNFFDLAVPSIRLMLLVRSNGRRLSFLASYRITLVAAFGNYVFPLRLGEVIKIFALSGENTNRRITKTEAAGFVLVERAMDFVVVIIFFFLGLLLNKVAVLETAYFVGLGMFLFIIVVLACFFFGRAHFYPRLLKKFPSGTVSTKIKDILARLYESVRKISSEKKLAGLVSYSIIYWAVVWLTYWFSFVSIGHPIGFMESFLIMTVGTLGLTIPSGPGGVGVLQGAFVVGGTLFGIDPDISLAAGLFYQAVQAVFVVGIGFSAQLFSIKKYSS